MTWKYSGGEEFLPPCLYPLLFLNELALGALSVPAGVVRYLHVAERVNENETLPENI